MKKYLSRGMIELFSVIVILLCALSVFTVSIQRRTTLTLDDGKIIYTGYVKNHRMNGQGTLAYSNGDTYEGEFSNGAFNGQGTFTSSSGWSYTGEFKDGQADGKGTLSTANGVYEGTFKQGIYQK